MKIKILNEDQRIKIAGNGLLVFSTFLVFQIFITFYQTTLILKNPLIPQELFYEINEKRILGGIFLTSGSLIMIILKSIKQNFLILIIGVLTILLFYSKTTGLI